MTGVRNVHIVGESPLLQEYASRCVEHKIAVTVRPNPQERGSLPSGVRRSAAIPKATGVAIELTNLSIDVKRKNLIGLDRALAADILILSSCVTVTVAEQSSWLANPRRLVGIGALPSFLDGSLIEMVVTRAASKDIVEKAKGFAELLDKEAVFVQDSVGLVMPRIVCMLANEAYFAMADGVAMADDIDTAMKLGTNYPGGPVEWSEKIGIKQVHAVLSAMHAHFGEERYRVAPALRLAVFEESV